MVKGSVERKYTLFHDNASGWNLGKGKERGSECGDQDLYKATVSAGVVGHLAAQESVKSGMWKRECGSRQQDLFYPSAVSPLTLPIPPFRQRPPSVPCAF